MRWEIPVVRASAEQSPRRMGTVLVKMAGTAALVGLAALANFILWLGWQRADYVIYQSWEVVGLVLGLGVIAVVSGWHRHPVVAVVMSTIVMTVSISLQGGELSHADGLWLIGSFLVALGTSLGVGLVAIAAVWFARRKSPSADQAGGAQ